MRATGSERESRDRRNDEHGGFENPATGERLVFRRTTADSGGAVLSFDYLLRAGGSVPLAHVHPRQEERLVRDRLGESEDGVGRLGGNRRLSYPGRVVRLADRDVRSALELVWDAAEYRGRDPFPHEFLERLAALIPADAIVGYHEVEARPPWRAVEAVEIPAEGVPAEFQEAAKPFCPEDPLQNGMLRSERRVLKLSDCLTRREMRKLGLYQCVWKPLGIDDSLRVWFPAPAGRARTLYLERGKRDFSERDRSLLELLRPSLIKMVERADRHRQADVAGILTPRELEILRWIERGRTTREIAAVLVVSPHTVRKHIENILEKLSARTRSEAVARLLDTR
ncbi:MAG: helix-turn-helix transcriptional regulator [Gemmatimonadota bacterium]|nr:helix-turn-helix transcriptional regulator [Gemmatimonadota bacterium]